MTDEERTKIRQEALALYRALAYDDRRLYEGFSRDHAAQLVAGAMPTIIQDVRLEEMTREWGAQNIGQGPVWAAQKAVPADIPGQAHRPPIGHSRLIQEP